jgi:hypothetical protein
MFIAMRFLHVSAPTCHPQGASLSLWVTWKLRQLCRASSNVNCVIFVSVLWCCSVLCFPTELRSTAQNNKITKPTHRSHKFTLHEAVSVFTILWCCASQLSWEAQHRRAPPNRHTDHTNSRYQRLFQFLRFCGAVLCCASQLSWEAQHRTTPQNQHTDHTVHVTRGPTQLSQFSRNSLGQRRSLRMARRCRNM